MTYVFNLTDRRLCVVTFILLIIIVPAERVRAGDYETGSVRVCVRPSVRVSVRVCVRV